MIYVFNADVPIEADSYEDADERLRELVNVISQDLGITLILLDCVVEEE